MRETTRVTKRQEQTKAPTVDVNTKERRNDASIDSRATDLKEKN